MSLFETLDVLRKDTRQCLLLVLGQPVLLELGV